MTEIQKDRLTDACDENDWRIEHDRRGCTITTANGARVLYAEDDDDRTVEIRASGRFKTVLRVLRVIDESRKE